MIILDDPMSDEPATEEERQKTLAWFDKCFNERIDNAVMINYDQLSAADSRAREQAVKRIPEELAAVEGVRA